MLKSHKNHNKMCDKLLLKKYFQIIDRNTEIFD